MQRLSRGGGAVVTVGSTNASRGSLRYYGEMSASIHDASVGAKVASMLANDFRVAPAYTEQQLHSGITPVLRVARRLLGLWF